MPLQADEPRALISAIIVAKNEEANIERCIRSLQGLCDEIVVLDTGSTDETYRIAERLGAKVYHEPWRDDFAYTNNIALGHATGTWVLLVDADEELTDTDCDSVRNLFRGNVKVDVLFIRILLKHILGHTAEMHSLRIVRKDSGAKWIYPIHSQIVIENRGVEESKVEVSHSGITLTDYGYAVSNEINRLKGLRNLRIAEKMEPSRHAWHCILKSAWIVEDWVKCRNAADRLLDLDTNEEDRAPLVSEEACVYGAASCVNMGLYWEAMTFVRVGQGLNPHNPDIHLVGSIASCEWYLQSLQTGNGITKERADLQLWVFKHNPLNAFQAHQTLLSTINGPSNEPSSTEPSP